LPSPYSPCRAIVSYDLWYCYELGTGLIIKVVFDNFTAKPEPGSDCQSFIDSLAYLDTTYQYTELWAALDAFNEVARNTLEDTIMRQLTYDSRNIFPCNSIPNNFLQSEFFTNICYTYCVGVIHHMGYDELLYQKATCGASCCQRSYLWCWSTTQNRVVKSNAAYSLVGSCSVDNTSCGLGLTKIGDCTAGSCEP
jgi:hypothetical protein